MSARLPAPAFDSELTLDSLFDAAERAQWETWLSALAGRRVRLLAPSATQARSAHACVLMHECEALLAVVAEPDAALPTALVAAFSAHVRERIRYRLAARLQLDASAHDWIALQASEARYRALAGELEQRVRSQVADLERARVYAFRAEHQRAVAQLAAGMAHEINNPIGFVSANLRSAQAYLVELCAGGAVDPALRADFEALLAESTEGIGRVAAIVSHLRVFSQVDSAAISAVRPRALVDAACALLERERPAGVQFCVDGDPGPWTCEAAALSQALFQLLRNALQAMGRRTGTVRVRLREAPRELAVDDEGCGMDGAVLARACDPFFSTREVGQGVGLGLSVATEVARRHGGWLELRSHTGHGTSAILHLGADVGRAP